MKYDEYLSYLAMIASHDDTLRHFNLNHDPKNGQFAKGSGGILSGIKAKREQKKAEKQKLNDARNDAIQYSDEFENSKEGRRLRDIHDKAYDAYFNSDTDDEKLEKRFMSAEHDYLSAMGRYEASKLIEKYGPELTAKIGWVNEYKDSNDLIRKYGEQYVDIHGV